MVSVPATATNLIGPISSAIVVSLPASAKKRSWLWYSIPNQRICCYSTICFIGKHWPIRWTELGAERRDRANAAMIWSFKYSVIWGAIVAILLLLFGTDVAALFDENEAVIQVASLYLLLVPLSYSTWGILMMASAIFNSLGKPVSSTIMSLIKCLRYTSLWRF